MFAVIIMISIITVVVVDSSQYKAIKAIRILPP